MFFGRAADGAPDPRLGVVPITDNSVSIFVPEVAAASAGTKTPMYLHAQTTGKGSIEEHGISAFLVTCNQLAAGAIAGSLQAGVSPFTVTNQLKEAFYVNGITAHGPRGRRQGLRLVLGGGLDRRLPRDRLPVGQRGIQQLVW